jgi:hypothetical protein
MEDTLVSYEVAMGAKSIGFDIPVKHFYHVAKVPYVTTGLDYRSDRDVESNWNNEQGSYPTMSSEVLCSVPSQSILHKWLREVHDLDINCLSYPSDNGNRKYFFNIEKFVDNIFVGEVFNCITRTKKTLFIRYEDAMDSGIVEALNHLKKQNNGE